jgi:gamma-glutamyltranspeptidase/glutathione hydrolase
MPRPARPTTLATRSIVATPHYLASQAGLRLLLEGGNAVDAAVAAAAALTVVYPQNTSIGGDLFALVHPASGGVQALNASGRAARLADLDFYRSRGHEAIPTRGPLAALTVPGAVSGWVALLDRFGRKELGQVLQPALEYAEAGAPVSVRTAEWLTTDRDVLATYPSSAAVYLRADGQPYGVGERLVQPGLAKTLRRLANGGAEVFYRGELAAELAAALEAGGSPLRAEDFAEHRADWQLPLTSSYRGQTTYQVGPNTQGLTALQILNIVDGWDLSSFGPESTAYYHHLTEATRQAFLDRELISDPDFVDLPIERLLSPDHAAARRAAIDPQRAGAATLQKIGGDTIYLAAADDDGNLISLIQSIYWDFGSGFVAGDSGVIIQNRGSFFSLDLEHPNVLAPGKRTFHTLIPAMYGQPDRPWLAYGNMGGEGQPQSQAAVLTRVVDFGYDLQAAIEAPRWLLGRTWGARSSALHLDNRIPAASIEALRSIGHPVNILPDWSEQLGHAQAVAIDRQRGILLGAADPRGDGAAVGF